MNKKITQSILFFFTCMVLTVQAANDSSPYVIKGQLVEAENEQPITYATLRLLETDSTFLVGTRTDEKGFFRLSPEKPGRYLLEIDCYGFEFFGEFVKLDVDKPEVDFGALALQPIATFLGEFEVSANRKQITMKGDTLVYDADAFRVPPGSTLGTLLSRLPGVTIEDGVIKYHGKEVNKLLINGKEFFAADLMVALENLPTEIVENIMAYETKTDEDKQKNTDTGERLNVLDITIKKEYMSTWIGNTDLAVGTANHYSERFFLTRFTDRLSLSAFGQINNLNDQSEASPNGGWRSNNWTPGKNTFRKMGVNAAWDNGKKEEEDGYLKLHGSLNASHNNINTEEEIVEEKFYPGNAHSYGNSITGYRESTNTVVLEGGITWRIDSLTNLFTKINYSHNDQHRRGYSQSATFNTNPYSIPGISDPIAAIFEDNPDENLLNSTINRNRMNNLNFYNSNDLNTHFYLGRKVHNKGHRVSIWSAFNTSKNHTTHSSLSDIRYYNEEADQPQRINNQHSKSPNTSRQFIIETIYEHVLSPQQRLFAGGGYMTSYSENEYLLYQLDSLDSWNNTNHPVGSLPSADSLALAINRQNSTHATYQRDGYGFYVQYRLMDKKNWSVTGSFNFSPFRTQMEYQRDILDTTIVDHRVYFNPYFWAKYKLKGEGQITFQYYGYRDFPELTQMLDVTDDRNPLYIVKGNPNLRSSWNNGVNINFNKTFGERKTSVWSNAGYRGSNTNISNTQTYDPVTGVTTVRPENVDGFWSTYANAGTNIPLDKKLRLNFGPSLNFHYRHNVGYFTSTEDNESLLNEQTSYGFTPRLNLNYRLEKLYVGTNNSLYIGVERNSLQPDADQTCRILSLGINGQYEFNWGTTVASDFGLYSCRGYTSPIMNNDQWLWNASVTQSFLKKKTLLVVIEARDILSQKVSQWANSNTYSRSTYHNNMFRNMDYIMAHVIYRFSVGKKAT